MLSFARPRRRGRGARFASGGKKSLNEGLSSRLDCIHRFFPCGLELVAFGPDWHGVGVGDSAAEEESEARILDGAREVEAVAVLVGRLVVGVLLVRLDLLLAIAGRLSDDVRPELQIRGGDTGLREV